MAVCNVTGVILNVDGTPMVGARLYFSIPRYPVGDADKNIIAKTHIEVSADAAGTFTIPLVQGIIVQVTCEDTGIKQAEFQVPATASANLFDLI